MYCNCGWGLKQGRHTSQRSNCGETVTSSASTKVTVAMATPAPSAKMGAVEEQGRGLKATFESHSWDLNYVWLRDHCRCKECYNEKTRQRLFDTATIPLDIRPSSTACTADTLDITWPDGHLTSLTWAWLIECGPGNGRAPPKRDGTTPERVLWRGEKLAGLLPSDVPFQAFLETEAGLRAAYESFYKFGLVFIVGCQPNSEDAARAANRFSRLQETFYGDVCVVSFEGEIADIGYSCGKLMNHTDTTYFHEPNGGLLFSSLKHDGEGGANPLVDGFYAADKLRREHPEHFEALRTIPVSMHYVDKERYITTNATMIQTDPVTGDLRKIRFNSNDRAPLSHLSPRDVERFYAAYMAFAPTLQSPDNAYVVKMTPGRLLIIDNWRLLHGREAFTGDRVTAFAYLQRDEMDSKTRNLLGVRL